MSKVELSPVASGYKLSTINANFQKIADELNNKVMYRVPPSGEPNAMTTSLDMNGQRIYNLGVPYNENDAARLRDVQQAVSGTPSANLIPFGPEPGMSSTNVEAAIVEAFNNTVRYTIPNQIGNSGKFLSTDGSNLLWGVPPTSGGGGGTGGVDTIVNGDVTGVVSSNVAIGAAQTASQNIVFLPGTYLISADITISSAVRFMKGAKLKIADGVTVTINGQINAGLWEIFTWTNTGKVVLGQGSTIYTVPQWWGASTIALAAANSRSFQACVYASYSKVMLVPHGSYNISGFTIPPIAEGGTSQLPFTLLGQGIDGNAGTGGSSLYWDGTGHCINLENTIATNSDNAITIEGIHIVGAGTFDVSDGSTPHNGIHAVRVNNLIIRRCQFTKTRQTGVYLERCYGSNVENCTFLENGWYGLWVFKQGNICRFKDIKSYRNGKSYDRLGANVYFNGGATFESLGAIIDNVDVSYSGNAARLFKKSDGTIVSVNVSSNVATVVTNAAHNLATGNQIAVTGCTTKDGLNSLFPRSITVVNATTFTFPTTFPVVDGAITDTNLAIGPCSFGLLLQNMQGCKIFAYAEDCMGPALSIDSTVTEFEISGGYWQGVDFGGVVLLDNPSNGEVGKAMRFFGPGAKLYIGVTARRHNVNFISSSCSFGNGAKLTENGTITMRNGVYFALGNPGNPIYGGSGTVWQRGDFVFNLFPGSGGAIGYQCVATGSGADKWMAMGFLA